MRCWCGCENFEPFSEKYRVCKDCGTLVLVDIREPEHYMVQSDEDDFYGMKYWTQHMREDNGFSDIFDYARSQLPERCTYWLKTVMKYKLPEAKTLEIGCSHGGLVYLMKQSGYQSAGTEMSQWVCDFSSRSFGIDMHCGDISRLNLGEGSFDIILMMDVLEHLVDPAATMKILSGLLKPDGLLVLQTPCYRGGNYSHMMETDDLFLMQLKDVEHLHLFNEQSIVRLLEQTGLTHSTFEPPLFAYDMFLVASRQPLKPDEQAVLDYLMSKPETRAILALIDLYVLKDQIDEDRDKRLESMKQYDAWLQQCRAQREMFEAAAVQRLDMLKASDEARVLLSSRLEVVEEAAAERLLKLQELEGMLATRQLRIDELERAADERLELIVKQDALLRDSMEKREFLQKACDERLEVIGRLNALLESVDKGVSGS